MNTACLVRSCQNFTNNELEICDHCIAALAQVFEVGLDELLDCLDRVEMRTVGGGRG